MIRILQRTFTKCQVSHRCGAEYEYKKRRKTTAKYKTVNFEQFVDGFISEIIEKVRTARAVLTV